MYVCGVTACDISHIGHACIYVTFDVLYRYLRHQVYYVRNFTDVDDKIIARANELKEDPISLSRRYCEEFHRDMVHCLPPSVEPRVSDHMPQIIDMIKQGKKQKMWTESLAALEKIIRDVLAILGLMPTNYSKILQQLKEKALKHARLADGEILQKIADRTTARNNKV